jgi:membrane protease YdiL (CAAX protease family)
MYQSPGAPNRNNYYLHLMAQRQERTEIRKSANRTAWTVLIGIWMMSGVLPTLGMLYLKASGISITAQGSFNGIPPVLYYLLISVDYVLGLAVPALLYFSLQGIPLTHGLPFPKVSAADTAIYVAFGCMVCLLANYPANFVAELLEEAGFNGQTPEMPLNNDPRVLALYGFVVVVIPPIVEEMLFRGVVLQSLKRYGEGFAIVVSAFFFALYHGNLIQIVFAFLAGLALGFVVVRTGSLLPSILIHCVNNAVSFGVEMVQRFYGDTTANGVYLILIVTFIALGLLSLYLLGRRHLLFTGRKSGMILPVWERIGAVFTNPGVWALTAYAVYASYKVMLNG